MKNQRKGTNFPKKFKVYDGQMTNDDLIKKLKKFPGNIPIWTEGCDCYGMGTDVIFDTAINGLMIKRKE